MIDPFFQPQVHQLVVNWTRDARLEALFDGDVGGGAAGDGIGNDREGMRVIEGGDFVDVRAEAQDLLPAAAFGHQFDGDEGRVFDDDAAHLGRRDQPVVADLVAGEHRGEQADELFAADGRAVVIPGAIAADAHVEIAAQRSAPGARLGSAAERAGGNLEEPGVRAIPVHANSS